MENTEVQTASACIQNSTPPSDHSGSESSAGEDVHLEVSYLDTSFLIDILFPDSLMDESPAWVESQKGKLSETTLVTGSRAEGLNMPMIMKVDAKLYVEEFYQSDLDKMYPWNVQIQDEGTDILDRPALVIETNRNHHGYLYVRYYSKTPDESECEGQETLQHHLVSSESKDYLSSLSMQEVEGRKFNMSHGPAAVSIQVISEQDHVYCLKCPTWPKVATDWLARERDHGWPNDETIAEVEKTGCMAVPVSHQQSLHPETEWRFSFSLAEIVLAKTLTPVQKKSYLILKMFHFQDLKEVTVQPSGETKGLSTYHMKNCFLWACEKLPHDSWTKKNLANCIMFMLDLLSSYIKEKNMPHYFIPKNNLLDQLDDTCLEVSHTRVGLIKQNLVQRLLDFRTKFKFFSGPFISSYENFLRDIIHNHEQTNRDESCKFRALHVKVAQQLAGSYLADAPLTQRLADDMLSCYGKLFKGKHALQDHNRIIIQPLLCAIDILESATFWTATSDDDYSNKVCEDEQELIASTKKIIALCKKIYADIDCLSEEESRRQLDTTLRGIESPTLESLAQELSTTALGCLPTKSNQVGSAQQQLTWTLATVCSLFACHIVLQYGTSNHLLNDHVSRLDKWIEVMKGEIPEIFIEGVIFIIIQALVKRNKLHEALERSHNINKSCNISHFLERLRAELTNASKSDNKPNTSDRYVDQYFNHPERIAYGRIFETVTSDATQCQYHWELMYFTKFKTMADRNSFKLSFCKLAERKFLEGIALSCRNREKSLSLKTDYANFLIHSNRFQEALNMLKDVVMDIDAISSDVYTEHIGYLRLALYPDLWAGMGRSLYRKVSFHTVIYAFFFTVISHGKLGNTEKALEVAQIMELRCDSVYIRNKEKDPWQIHANNYSLLGHAYRICGMDGKAIMAFAMVTYIREDSDQPRQQQQIEGMKTFNLHVDAEPIVCLRTCMPLLWKDSNCTKTYPPLLQTLYPKLTITRSIIHFYHLVHGKYPSPSDAKPYLQVFVNEITAEKHDMDSFALCFSVMVETTFPSEELPRGLERFLGVIYPSEVPGVALIKYISELTDKHEMSDLVDAVMRKFFIKDQPLDGMIVLRGFLYLFHKESSLEEGIKCHFELLCPNKPLTETFRKYFGLPESISVERVDDIVQQIADELRQVENIFE